jgi:hypothetical protein
MVIDKEFILENVYDKKYICEDCPTGKLKGYLQEFPRPICGLFIVHAK